jgi:hypothetical protein
LKSITYVFPNYSPSTLRYPIIGSVKLLNTFQFKLKPLHRQTRLLINQLKLVSRNIQQGQISTHVTLFQILTSNFKKNSSPHCLLNLATISWRAAFNFLGCLVMTEVKLWNSLCLPCYSKTYFVNHFNGSIQTTSSFSARLIYAIQLNNEFHNE